MGSHFPVAGGQAPLNALEHEFLCLSQRRGRVSGPYARALLVGKSTGWGEPLDFLQMDVSVAFSPVPFGAVWRGLQRKLGPKGAFAIMRLLLGAGCTVAWAQGQTRISLRRGGDTARRRCRVCGSRWWTKLLAHLPPVGRAWAMGLWSPKQRLAAATSAIAQHAHPFHEGESEARSSHGTWSNDMVLVVERKEHFQVVAMELATALNKEELDIKWTKSTFGPCTAPTTSLSNIGASRRKRTSLFGVSMEGFPGGATHPGLARSPTIPKVRRMETTLGPGPLLRIVGVAAAYRQHHRSAPASTRWWGS